MILYNKKANHLPNPFLFQRYMKTAGPFNPLTALQFIFHLPKMVRLCYRLMNDKRVPAHLKFLCYGAILYFVFPFDLVPDLMPFFLPGRVDDIVILVMAFRYLLKNAPPDVVREHVDALSGKRASEES